MPEIKDIPTIVSKEISDNYTTERNTFVSKEKEFETEVGDIKQDSFYPQIKIKRWSNECNFSIRLKDFEGDVIIEKEKIKCVGSDKECRFYPVTELVTKTIIDDNENEKEIEVEEIKNYEFEIILKEKPKTNKIEFSIETKELRFLYQDSLKVQGNVPDGGYTTDTQVFDKDGKVIEDRPENVVGSYAVYHSSKSGNNYKAGKAFHIYRPQIFDAVGKKVWGALNIDLAKKLLTVEIPQKFLDEAVYPVSVDPTFGYTTAGASEVGNVQNYMSWFEKTYSPVSNGIGSSMSAYMRATGTCNVQLALYEDTGALTGTLVDNTGTIAVTISGTKSWHKNHFTGTPSLLAATSYKMVYNRTAIPPMAYDTNASYTNAYQTQTYGTWSAMSGTSWTGYHYEYSIYTSYSTIPAADTESIDLELSDKAYAYITDANQTGLDITGDISIEAWIKMEQLPSTGGDHFYIASKWLGTGNQRSYHLIITNTDKIQFQYTHLGGTSYTKEVADTAFDAGDLDTWIHVAITADVSAQDVILYVNGSPVASTLVDSASGAIYDGTGAFYIGSFDPGAYSFMDGLITDVRVWNDIRTSTEISDNYQSRLIGNEAGLVGYWKFDGTDALLDETANNNDLSTNAVQWSTDSPFAAAAEDDAIFFSMNF